MAIPKPKPKTQRRRTPSTSQEYKRFESMMKRLVRVPKKEIDARREAEKKRDLPRGI